MTTIPLNTETDFSELSLGNFNVATKAALYEKNQPKNFLSASAFKLNKRPLVISFQATVSSNQILVSEFDNSESYSLPVELEDDEQLAILSRFSDALGEHLEEVLDDSDAWTLTEIVKDDKIYLKVKFAKNQKTPTFKSNITINNKKIQDTKIFQGQKVTVTANVNFYFNFATQVAGASLALQSLIFETNEDEEEVIAAETPKRKSRDIVPETPRKARRTVAELPVASPVEFHDGASRLG